MIPARFSGGDYSGTPAIALVPAGMPTIMSCQARTGLTASVSHLPGLGHHPRRVRTQFRLVAATSATVSAFNRALPERGARGAGRLIVVCREDWSAIDDTRPDPGDS
ncbi:hypothetical protein GCM10010172_34930 [Paractinoplanes ferrugineus]|uniref:Uncharacterized protein n=1 Tax=Paractinoplanes ferrugineus TaxID=113564 RepID=A0A919J8C2_9ACTN|nr:hypothetical protein Afe05nite_72740 [Actinoplanes ferrugineus]